MTQEGFASICTVANGSLYTLQLGASSLNLQWLEQFCTIQDSPSELGFYSTLLHPMDFIILFMRFKAGIKSIGFIYNSDEDHEISQLIRWLDAHIGCNGGWYRYIGKGICHVHFIEDSDSDSDSDSD